MRLKSKGDPDKPVGDSPRSGRSTSGVPSIVSPEMTVTGNVVTSGEMQVDGAVDGDVRAENLTVGENGRINGVVEASNLRVLGRIEGEIHAANVTVLASARVDGDVVHESLAIEAGAMIEGHCRRRPEDATAKLPGRQGKPGDGAMARASGGGPVTNGRSDDGWPADDQGEATVS